MVSKKEAAEKNHSAGGKKQHGNIGDKMEENAQ